MRIKWLRRALDNLDAEATYIEQTDAAASRLIVQRVLDSVDALVHQPGLGRPGRVAGTRELVVRGTRYIVPYRIKSESIEILRVFHTSRRLPRNW